MGKSGDRVQTAVATPVKYLKDASTIATFKESIIYLTKIGFKLVLNIIDNVWSSPRKEKNRKPQRGKI